MAGAIGILIVVSGATTLAISGTYYGNVTTPLSIGYINLLGFLYLFLLQWLWLDYVQKLLIR